MVQILRESSARLKLPDGTITTIAYDKTTTVKMIMKRIAAAASVDPNCVTCYYKNNLLFPFVRITNVVDEALHVCFPHNPAAEHRIVTDAAFTHVFVQRNPRKGMLGCQRLSCLIGNAVIPMIIDTGSSVSFLSLNHVNEADLEKIVDCHPSCRPAFCAVTHETLPAVGVIHSVDVFIHDIQTTAQFIVLSSTSASGILGIDWLKKYNARIDPRKGLITIKGATFQFPG
jgi:predicted aspartyl protease